MINFLTVNIAISRKRRSVTSVIEIGKRDNCGDGEQVHSGAPGPR